MTTYRPVDAADVDHLWHALFYASHSDEQEGATPDTCRDDPALARYVERWGRPGDTGVLACDGERVVGAAWLRLPTPADRGLSAFVADDVPELAIGVLPGHTGVGIGTVLLRTLVDDAADAARHPAITLNARSDNPAIRLYERIGFVTIEIITNRVGTTSVKMLLPLRSRG